MPERSPISRTPQAQAGLDTTMIDIEDIGWREDGGGFVDLDNRDIELAFKLYPWEWMFHDEFGAGSRKRRRAGSSRRGRPSSSNKGILPLLWEMFPGHPNLLPAFFEDDPNAAQLGSVLRAQAALFARRRQCRRWSAPAQRFASTRGLTAPRVSFVRRWRRCLIFRTNIRCWAAGWSITCRAGYRSARTRNPITGNSRGSCRTRSSKLRQSPFRRLHPSRRIAEPVIAHSRDPLAMLLRIRS